MVFHKEPYREQASRLEREYLENKAWEAYEQKILQEVSKSGEHITHSQIEVSSKSIGQINTQTHEYWLRASINVNGQLFRDHEERVTVSRRRALLLAKLKALYHVNTTTPAFLEFGLPYLMIMLPLMAYVYVSFWPF